MEPSLTLDLRVLGHFPAARLAYADGVRVALYYGGRAGDAGVARLSAAFRGTPVQGNIETRDFLPGEEPRELRPPVELNAVGGIGFEMCKRGERRTRISA